MAVVQDTRNALWRRDEQLKRWNQSETFSESSERDISASKIKFDDGCVFLAACSSGDKDEVERLLDRGADINTANIDGLTALHQACIDDNLDMVEYLIQRGADIDACDNEGWTALHATSSCGFTEVARSLIEKGANLAAVNNEGELPIDLADGDEMEDLISDEMDKQDIDAESARNEEEAVMLRDANQWLNGTYSETPHPKSGATALHVAAAKGYMNVMKILIQAGADVDTKDFDGWTPLHAAAHWGQDEACKALVQNFCNMEVRNQVGQTALDIADSDVEPLMEQLKQEQATLKKDREENNLQNDNLSRNVPPLKRRSSVTRMSVKQKANVVQETTSEERELLRQAHQMVEEKDEERSGKSSEEEAASSADESSSESDQESITSPKSNTEKQNEINRQSSLITKPQINGEVRESTEELERTKSPTSPPVSSSPTIIPPSKTQETPLPTHDTNSPAEAPPPSLAPIKEKKPSQEQESPTSPISSKELLRKKDERLERLQNDTEDKDSSSDDNVFRRPRSENIESSLTYAKQRPSGLSRTASIPAGLLRSQVSGSSSKLPLSKSESLDMAPSSWRAGLRKTGSSSAVPEITVSDPDKIPRSASSSGLASDKHDTEQPQRHRIQSSGSGDDSKNRFNDLYSRYSSLVTSNTSAGSSSSTSKRASAPPITTSATTTSSAYTYTPYVPLSRRRPVSDISDIGEKSRDLSLLAKGGTLERQTSLGSSSSTSPGAGTGQRRSFEPPKRDEEKEVERKARAKRARESRRSTQGVTKEDLEKAEQALQAADQGHTFPRSSHLLDAHRGSGPDDRSDKENNKPEPDSSSITRLGNTSKAKGSNEDKKDGEDNSSLLSSYRRSRDSGILTDNSSSFRSSGSRLVSSGLSTVGSTATTTVISSSAPSTTPFKTPYRSKYLSNRHLEMDEDSHDDSRKDAEKEDPSQKSAAIRARRKRDSRRPTGKVTLEDLPPSGDDSRKTKEDSKKEDDKMLSSQRYGTSRYSADSVGGGSTSSLNDVNSAGRYSGAGRSDRPSSYTPGSSSAYSRTYSSVSLPDSKDNSIDYKKMYEDEKTENDKLKRDVKKLQMDLKETRVELEKQRLKTESVRTGSSESREKRALERRISEQEEELKAMEGLKADNQRLKEENGALIRVISKLSK